MILARQQWLPFAALSIAIVAVTVALRPLWPIDETRYVSVAWEMWLRGDFLVPHLNGVPYSDKPPLFFWLINLGWAVFGVNDVWPRLIPPLIAIANLALTASLARRLWPQQQCDITAAWLLFGSLLWVFFITPVMFDMLVVCFTLLAMHGLIDATRGYLLRGFALFGVAIGLGLLSKGPVILLYTLPVALAKPWWMAPKHVPPGRWYLGLAAAFLLSLAIIGAWALPAANAGGNEYRAAILWGQTAGRMADSFAHRHPWWWYLPLLPVILLPWTAWPTLWRGFARLWRAPADRSVRFVIAWILPAFVALSLISGKQPHYLLPLFPALALLAARALSDSARIGRVTMLASMSVLLITIGFVVAIAMIGPSHDVRSVANFLATLEDSGQPTAHVGKYYGQYQFLGRLHRPLVVISDSELKQWAALHPNGHVVTYDDPNNQTENTSPPETGQSRKQPPIAPEYKQDHRGKRVFVWSSSAIVAKNGG